MQDSKKKETELRIKKPPDFADWKIVGRIMAGSPSDDKPRKKWPRILFTGFILLVFFYLLYTILRSPLLTLLSVDLSGFLTFNTIFISILMQAFSFMLIGILVSSWLHVFVPENIIVRIFPVKYGLGFLSAMFAGILFPVCECAIVPVVSGLVRKGVPTPIAITFMLSAPIINPIVILSTLYAFPGQPEIAALRVGFGLLIALLVGLFLFFVPWAKADFAQAADACHCGCCCGHDHEEHEKEGFAEKLKEMFLYAGDEFFGVGKYLIIGAFLTALIQAFVPRSIFVTLAGQNGISLFIMMAAAFLFSVCSTSDAFIARSFLNRFSAGSVMGFLVFGPMMDLKNLLMLLSVFKKEYVIKLSVIIFVFNFIILNVLNRLFF